MVTLAKTTAKGAPRCQREVVAYDNPSWPRTRQCARKAVNGTYCKIHTESARAERRKQQDIAAAKDLRKFKMETRAESFYAALLEIMNGHESPEALAEIVTAEMRVFDEEQKELLNVTEK